MQLKHKRILDVIALSSLSLLNASHVSAETPATNGDKDSPWKIDTAILYYDEQDRVNAVEPVINISKAFGEDSIFSARLSFDTLSGPSHNGASVSNEVQTFTSPSGEETYEVAPGDIPLDPNFEDQRTAASFQLEHKLGRLSTFGYGAAFSTETDYQSASLNGSLARDFNQRNTSLSAGISFTQDTISPREGVPVALSRMSNLESNGDEKKTTLDLLLGATQVISRNTLMQFNYGFGQSDGYHNDPYKIVSIIDRSTDSPEDYIFENRPDSRTKHSFYWRTKHQLNDDMIDASWRFMSDDWGVDSHTLDLRYRWNFSANSYLEPHFRYYTQSAANFYREDISSTEVLPQVVSADYRLGGLEATTAGIKWATKLDKQHEFNIRVELYEQSGDTAAADLSALITQLGYTFYF
ncbi:hypothetical protein A9Q99_19140 [Gammaproteobacteria bacterium 45_16_T64]|nr:hypothetical protein A9Q99_19140 [Gammaproteobacteria bacterium 45_16_T64]